MFFVVSKPAKSLLLCKIKLVVNMQIKNYQQNFLRSTFTAEWNNWSCGKNQGLPMPEKQKPYDTKAKLIDLVSPEQFIFDLKLLDAIKYRRSRRKFSQDFLTLKELAFLLWATQGITNEAIDFHRAVPSAGARHPFVTYIVGKRVENLTPGVYRYLPLDHKLCLVSQQSDIPEKIAISCLEINQTQVQGAAVVFVWAAIPYRTSWRFGPYADKFIAIESGHLGQNLYLAAEAIGAGVCTIAAYDQDAVDKIIEVNGKDEFAIYLATVGKVKR